MVIEKVLAELAIVGIGFLVLYITFRYTRK